MSLKEEGQRDGRDSQPKLRAPKPIKTKAEFTELFKRGRKTTISNISMWSLKTNNENQLSVIISAKQGSAVQRNRARRLIKEIIRQNKPKIKQGWRLAIKINAPLLDNYERSKKKIFQLFVKAGLIEKNSDVFN